MQADLHAATPASSPNYEPAALSGAVLPLRLPQTSRRCGSCSAASYLPTPPPRKDRKSRASARRAEQTWTLPQHDDVCVLSWRLLQLPVNNNHEIGDRAAAKARGRCSIF